MMNEPNGQNKESGPPGKYDKVYSDFISGEIVGYDSMTSFSGVAIGRGIQDSLSQTSPGALLGEELSKIFASIYSRIRATPGSANSAELKNVVERIEHEVFRSEAANSTRLERLLRTLFELSPEIAEDLTGQLTQLALNPAISKAINLSATDEPASRDLPTAPEMVVAGEIQAAGLPEDVQAEMIKALELIHQEIEKETLTKGGWADLRTVQSALSTLQRAGRNQTGLRLSLWNWLVEGEGIPPSIRILAKKMFA